MTYRDLDQALRIPDRWIDSMIADHRKRHPETRHLPSRRTIRGILNHLATRIRKPAGRHSRADRAYTDETRPQIARAVGVAEQTVGDGLAVLDGAGWSLVLIRGSKYRGSCRALPILDRMAAMTDDDLNGEPPAMINPDLSGTIGDLSGISRHLSGDDPTPPDISNNSDTSIRAPAAASNGGRPLGPMGTDGGDIETIAASITDPRMRATYLRGAKSFRASNGDAP